MEGRALTAAVSVASEPTTAGRRWGLTAVIGLVAAFAMLKTRSVYPAMLVHAAVNAVVVAF
jgi:hypothetical protein